MNKADSSQQQAWDGKPRIALQIVVLLLCAAILIASRLFQLDGGKLYLFGFKWPHRCPLYETVGVKCALCGLTRSFCLLAHGDMRQSLKFHTLGPAIFAFICLQIPYRIYALMIYPRKINAKTMNIGLYIGVLLIVVLLINWLIYLGGLIL